MFCKNCGASMPDGASFCSQCGAKVDVPVENNTQSGYDAGTGYGYNQNVQPDYNGGQQPTPQYQDNGYDGGYYGMGDVAAAQVKTAKKNKLIGIIAVAAVAVIAIVVVLVLVLGGGGKGAKDVDSLVEKFVSATMDADVDEILSLMPDEIVDSLVEESGLGSRKNLENYLEAMLEMSVAAIEDEYGDDFSVSHRIVDEYDYDEYDLEYIKEQYSEYGLDIQEAKDIDVELTIFYDGTSETDSSTITVIKVGNRWYMPDVG